MKQIKTILIAILLTLTANADWKPLKTLDHYGPKAFTLKKGVAYVEIRKYTEWYRLNASQGTDTTKEEDTVLKMYRHSMSYFGSAVKRTFQSIPGKKKFAFKKGSAGGMGVSLK